MTEPDATSSQNDLNETDGDEEARPEAASDGDQAPTFIDPDGDGDADPYRASPPG